MNNDTSQLCRTINVGRFRHPGSVRMHRHEEAELVLVVENECTFEVEDKFLTASPGEIAVLPAKIPHAQLSEGMTETRYCLFRSGSFAFDERFRVVQARGDPFFYRWFEDLARLFDNPQESPSHSVDALFAALVERIKQKESRDQRHASMHPALRRAVTLMEDQFQEKVEGAQVAHCAKVSASHLRMLFREEFGIGPNRYLKRLRLRASMEFLRNPYLNVSEVAYRCGFHDPNYFTREFRREFGVSPGQWREAPGENLPLVARSMRGNPNTTPKLRANVNASSADAR